MTRSVLLLLLLPSCAAYHEAWRRDGACSVVCNYHQTYLSTAYTLDPHTCRCYTPQLASFNEGRMLPLDSPSAVVTCGEPGGCAAEAARIVLRHPWRALPQDLLYSSPVRK